MKPDILVFMSDQHGGKFMSHTGDDLVRTPNLDRIAENGASFTNAYTSCPLCVPARLSFLTGQLPARSKIFTNEQALPSDQATFLHSLTAAGYETVLCGRMHFRGPDQRHGFSKRIFGDMTPTVWNSRSPSFRENRNPKMAPTFVDPFASAYSGKGFSAVLEYDRHVIDAALEYLKMDHEKPQCVVIGTYGPHSPYIAPPDLYDYYREKIDLPRSMKNDLDFDTSQIRARVAVEKFCYQVYHPEKEISDADILASRAAYLGMIEYQDQLIGEVKDAWDNFLQKHNREGLFVYTSDHGQQNGEKGFFGKVNFFEESACIPFIFEGHGVKKHTQINTPVSLMDISPTLCEVAGAEAPPGQDGLSLIGALQDGEEDSAREVLSDIYPLQKGYTILKDALKEIDLEKLSVPGRMLRSGKWKYIHYYCNDADDLLFDLENDPYEQVNALESNGSVAKELKEKLCQGWDPESILNHLEEQSESMSLIDAYGTSLEIKENDSSEFWFSENVDKYDCVQ